jgi:radical SAM protein with 4Fe4S-binding SPASM domain
MTLTDAFQYSGDPFTHNYGAETVRAMFVRRYGERYTRYREDWARTERYWTPDFPLNLVFDLIDKCNLACPQCLRAPDLIGKYPTMLGTKKSVSIEDIIRMLDEGEQHGLPSVNIGGSGEATLHPDFLKICRAIMDRDVMELRVLSNGLKLDEQIAGAVIEMQLHMFSISIDGFSASTYGKTRGKAISFERCVENARKFAEHKRRLGAKWPLFRVSFVRQEANAHETEEFVNYWSRYADMVDVQTFHDFRAKDYSLEFDCSEPYRRLNIWAYGGMGPCCGFPGIVYNVGDWKTQSLREIWHGEPMREMRKMMKDHKWKKPCLECQGTRTTV